MADEPNRQMDQLLREYAQQRRQRADLRLHPASRKMLQEEVARKYKTTERPPFWSRLRVFWPQIAFGTGLGAILLIATLSLRQPGRTSARQDAATDVLARAPSVPAIKADANSSRVENSTSLGFSSVVPASANKDQEQMRRQLGQRVELRTEPAQGVAPANQLHASAALSDALSSGPESVAPHEPSQSRDRDERSAKSEKVQIGRQAAANSSGLGSAPTPPLFDYSKKGQAESKQLAKPTAPQRLGLEKEGHLAEENFAAADAPGSPFLQSFGRAGVSTPSMQITNEKTAKPLARLDSLTNLGAALRTRFMELPGRSSRQNTPVLSSFQMEQSGQDLSIVDGDGSVYRGQILPSAENAEGVQVLPPPRGSVLAGAATPQPAVATQDAAGNVYHFQVQGINRTLGQNVIVQGRYEERTNAAPSPERTFSYSAQAERTAPRQGQNPLVKARRFISGQATIGQTNQFPLRAVSVDP